MLILVRHGRTTANASGLLLGRADPELDAVGRDQARQVAAALGGVERVVTSPLRRTMQTAEALGVPLEIDERWIELDYGELDERPLAEVPADVWRAWRADPAFTPPGGESLTALAARVAAACEALVADARTADIVIVSHVSPIKAAVAWALDVGIEISWRMHLSPASITRLAVGGHGPVVASFNETAHLTAS